jgi:hypothetical protein
MAKFLGGLGCSVLGIEQPESLGEELIMFSRVIRRTHMYLALFLMPWMLMYALSTLAMNHRNLFRDREGGNTVRYEKEKELLYDGVFPSGASPKQVARQILSSLDMKGSHSTNNGSDGQGLQIHRHDLISPRRITYTPADRRILIEREIFQTPHFLERLHRRRGYQHEYPLDDAWAFSVDLVVGAMAFWVLSGLWMWWELQSTRRWGALCTVAGLGLFGFFLFTI